MEVANSQAQREKTSDASALIVVDVQTCFTRPASSFDKALEGGDSADFFQRVDNVVIPNLQDLLSYFRREEYLVYFTEMGSLRTDGGDLPLSLRVANEKSLSLTGVAVIPHLGEEDSRTDSRVRPLNDEVVFRKTTTGTLASTPLAQNLRALGTESVFVAGIVTDCCVAQTARELADQDFDVCVVEDACASYDSGHHRMMLEVFQNFYGSVASTREVIDQNHEP